MKLSVIIPCYNEEESIENVIKSLPQEVAEIIIIDNNSTDRTSVVAKRLGAKVVFEPLKGYGRALKVGFRDARGNVIIALDGDGQYPSEKILEMVHHMAQKKLDFVSGNRFPLASPSMSFTRIIGNKILTFFANLLFGLELKDSQSGMWIFRKKILDEITLESDGMSLSEEIKIKVATHQSLRFEEHYIPYHPRIGESKLLPLKDGFTNVIFLFKLRMKLKRTRLSKSLQI